MTKYCQCGHPQSFPIPHRHDQTKREKEIIAHFEAQAEDDTVIWTGQQQQVAKLKADVDTLYQKEKGDFWYWQGDGEDHLESTTCPILIKAQDLRDLLKEQAEKDRAEIEKIERENFLLSEKIIAQNIKILSFPAEQQQALAEAEKLGERKLAKWIENNLAGGTENYIGIDGRKWQAKLKSLETP